MCMYMTCARGWIQKRKSERQNKTRGDFGNVPVLDLSDTQMSDRVQNGSCPEEKVCKGYYQIIWPNGNVDGKLDKGTVSVQISVL